MLLGEAHLFVARQLRLASESEDSHSYGFVQTKDNPIETIAKVFHELYSDSLEVNRTRDQNESMLERSKLHKNSSFTSRIHNNFNLEQFIVTYAIASIGVLLFSPYTLID